MCKLICISIFWQPIFSQINITLPKNYNKNQPPIESNGPLEISCDDLNFEVVDIMSDQGLIKASLKFRIGWKENRLVIEGLEDEFQVLNEYNNE